jgi:hypothetical protein
VPETEAVAVTGKKPGARGDFLADIQALGMFAKGADRPYRFVAQERTDTGT